MAAPSREPPCGFCEAPAAPYCCPRCNSRVCSLRCYRSHGGCAEAFYRQQVLQALSTERSGPGRASGVPLLRGLRAAGDLEEPAGRGLWGTLSEAEREEFRRLLGSGEVWKVLPAWRPWWWRRRAAQEGRKEEGKGGEEGKEEGDEEEDEEVFPSAPPPPPSPTTFPTLSSLRSLPPSPLLPFQLPNVLFGYVFALSLHLGDDAGLGASMAEATVAISAALRSTPRDPPFSSTQEAIEAARRDLVASGYPQCPLGDAGTVLAVAELLEGGNLEGMMGNQGSHVGGNKLRVQGGNLGSNGVGKFGVKGNSGSNKTTRDRFWINGDPSSDPKSPGDLSGDPKVPSNLNNDLKPNDDLKTNSELTGDPNSDLKPGKDPTSDLNNDSSTTSAFISHRNYLQNDLRNDPSTSTDDLKPSPNHSSTLSNDSSTTSVPSADSSDLADLRGALAVTLALGHLERWLRGRGGRWARAWHRVRFLGSWSREPSAAPQLVTLGEEVRRLHCSLISPSEGPRRLIEELD